MQRGDLPDYKQNFLQQMDYLRQQQLEIEQFEYTNQQNPIRSKPQNNINNTSQYSSSLWKQQLNKTSYQKQHHDIQFELNKLMNPQVSHKKNNIGISPITEFSNAKHNNTVFINPKHTSC